MDGPRRGQGQQLRHVESLQQTEAEELRSLLDRQVLFDDLLQAVVSTLEFQPADRLGLDGRGHRGDQTAPRT